ncbi:MAG: DoxX family membrane protein [Planctomycetes bacterium]|nr:DoxX family membrane protein [Planctomycetota bacterium]
MNAKKLLAILISLGLGAIFIYASWEKIGDPPDFAHLIYNYKLTPGSLINLLAIYLPWVELLAGLALVAGLGRRGAAALTTALLVLFIAALGFNYLRGHAIECGCFSVVLGPPKTAEQLLGEMRVRILEDLGLLAAAAILLALDWKRRPAVTTRPGS